MTQNYYVINNYYVTYILFRRLDCRCVLTVMIDSLLILEKNILNVFQ